MVKFFITPTGHCSVFPRRRGRLGEARPVSLASEVLPGTPSASSRALPQLAHTATAFAGAAPAWPHANLGSRAEAMGRRQASRNVLEPLLLRRQAQSGGGGSRQEKKASMPTKPLEGLAPWEVAELRYLKDLRNSAFSPRFGAGLLDCYSQQRQPAGPPALVEAAARDLQQAPVAKKGAPEAFKRSKPEAAAPLSVLEAAMAMPLPDTPPRTPRNLTQLSLDPLAVGLSAPSTPSAARVVPLTLPGMKTVCTEATAIANGKWPDLRTSVKANPATPRKLRMPFESPRRESLEMPRKSVLAGGKLRASIAMSPFVNFLTKPPSKGSGDDTEDHDRENFGFDRNSGCQDPSKTVDMVGSLQQWLNKGQKGHEGRHGTAVDELLPSGVDKAEWRGLIVLAKKYSLPVNEVRDIKREFSEHDTESTGHITRNEFSALIRKRTDLHEDEDIPFHLLKGVSEAGERIGFEEFLRWSMLTAWTEEMMMPSACERQLRQLAREQEMALPDVEKVKLLFDSVDTDKSGEIDEGEFRHILYKMLHVHDVTDVPLKRLQRYWREVDLDGSGFICFNEFLIWCKTSFNLVWDGRLDTLNGRSDKHGQAQLTFTPERHG